MKTPIKKFIKIQNLNAKVRKGNLTTNCFTLFFKSAKALTLSKD